MAKAVKKNASKKRASTYEPKVKFEGTFEDMIAISTTVQERRRKLEKRLPKRNNIFKKG
jgi:hypothetical protein